MTTQCLGNIMQASYTDKVYTTIKQAHDLGLPYITREQLIKNLSQTYPNIYWSHRISQCLYHLLQSKKFRRQRIRKYYNKEHHIGYTITNHDINLR